jgi:hypothetical protein
MMPSVKRAGFMLGAGLAVVLAYAVGPMRMSRLRAEESPEKPKMRLCASLGELVGPNDALAVQDLRFDAREAADALAYIQSGDPALLDRLENSPAAAHIFAHARNYEYDVPRDSTRSLILQLIKPDDQRPRRVATCGQSLEFFTGPMLDDPHWVEDVLKCLPEGFRFKGSLFLTFGYDIGVAFAPNASLNGAHRKFDGHSRELLYYAIHELHHVGFMSYQAPRPLSDFKTCDDLLRFVVYSTQLEGMAVFAAWDRRSRENALSSDGDYVALQDEEGMKKIEETYFADLDYLKKRQGQAADKVAWAVPERMSGDRLWYRVGARMALRIDRELGRPALLDLIKKGPADFMSTYLDLRGRRESPAR